MHARRLAVAVAVAALGVLAARAAPAGETVRFELCGAIASVEVAELGGPQPHHVLVQLEREAAERFAGLTRDHVGETLEITHGGHAFVRARIQAEIRSGTISATYGERADAEQARSTLRDASVCQSAAP